MFCRQIRFNKSEALPKNHK